MKSKFTNIMLFIIMIMLIGAIAVFGMAIYANITSMDTEDTIYTINTITTTFDDNEDNINVLNKNKVEEDITVEDIDFQNEAKEKYFYEQLTDIQKVIYNGLQENKENMQDGEYKIQYGGIFSDILKEEGGSKKLGKDYQSAVESFLYDNPDVFYLDANKLFLNVETSKTIFKTTYNVYIGPAKGSTYYADGFTSEIQVKAALDKIEETKNTVLLRLTGNTYRDILKIHDYLVESIDYDKNYSSIGCYSIYGALVDKKCVCEGYAKALKYLLNEANIPSVIVQGSAKNMSGKTEDHAWNIVCLDNKWYYIDVTWDDPIIIGEGQVAKSVHYKYFLKGSKKFDKDHTLSYQFSDKGRTYRYPVAQEYDYK